MPHLFSYGAWDGTQHVRFDFLTGGMARLTSKGWDGGKLVFEGKGRCATCHVPPLFTEPGQNLHAPGEIGVDSFQADRSPTHMYRTAPLAGLWSHQKGGFYHDGRFANLPAVVDHYDSFLGLKLTDQEKRELIEYLKSL